MEKNRKTLCEEEHKNCEVVIQNKQLQQELDKYKAKEKELREFIKDDGCGNIKLFNNYWNNIDEEFYLEGLLKDILDIFDEEE